MKEKYFLIWTIVFNLFQSSNEFQYPLSEDNSKYFFFDKSIKTPKFGDAINVCHKSGFGALATVHTKQRKTDLSRMVKKSYCRSK